MLKLKNRVTRNHFTVFMQTHYDATIIPMGVRVLITTINNNDEMIDDFIDLTINRESELIVGLPSQEVLDRVHFELNEILADLVDNNLVEVIE